MLENMRRQGASIFVYLIFCLLIAIFIINFGPSGGRTEGGCSGAANPIITVDGNELTQADFHVAYSNRFNRGQNKQKVYIALEELIRREILAQEAEARGMRINGDLIDNEIKEGHFYLGGQHTFIPGIFTEDGLWNLQAFKGWAAELNVSMNSYRDEQRRELMASMMAEILKSSVQVSRDEALAQYLFENNTVTYDVVAFKPETYRAAMKLTDADVDRFLALHGDEVQARYKADERTYKGVKPQLELRQIFIAKLEPAKPAGAKPADKSARPAAKAGKAGDQTGKTDKTAAKTDKTAAKTDKTAAKADKTAAKTDKTAAKTDKPKAAQVADKGAGKAEKPVGMPIDEAKAKLEAVRKAVAAGKQKFEDAARKLSTNPAAKASGGDLGWRTADSPMLAEKAVNDAVKTLEPGEMTPVITTDRGAYLVIAEDKRQGDLTYDQVKHDIAKQLARDEWGKEAAKRAALAALDHAHAGGVDLNLDQLYKRKVSPMPSGDLQKILNDPNLSPAQKQQILQQLLQKSQQQGSLEVESKDQPAAWYADSNGGAAGSAAKPAGKTAPPAADKAPPADKAGATKPAGQVADKAGSAATGSAPAPAAGSGATPAAGTAAPAADKAASSTEPALVASKDQLPEMADITAPDLNRFGPTPRTPEMPGLGTSKAAAAALFDELAPGDKATRVYDAGDAYVVVQLIAREQPKVADFDKDADRQIAALRETRAAAFLEGWMKDRCEALLKADKIRPNLELITDHDDQNRPLPIKYRPCSSFR